MSEPRAAPEPSMEEILASIRRIIAENAKPEEQEPEIEPGPVPDLPPMADPPSEAPPAAADAPALPPSGPAQPQSPGPPASPAAPALVLGPKVTEDLSPARQATAATAHVPPATFAPRMSRHTIEAKDGALLLEAALPPEEPLLLTRPAMEPPAPPVENPPLSSILRAAENAAEAHGSASPSPYAGARQVASALAPAPLPGKGPTGAARTVEELVLEALEPKLQAWLDQHLEEIVERRVQQEIERISNKSKSPPGT